MAQGFLVSFYGTVNLSYLLRILIFKVLYNYEEQHKELMFHIQSMEPKIFLISSPDTLEIKKLIMI